MKALHLSRAGLRRERGSVFIVTIGILIVLTSLAIMLATTMRVEAGGSANYAAQLQSQAVANAAVTYIKTILDGHDGLTLDSSSYESQAVPVGTGYFWLLQRDDDSSDSYAFGLVDEEGKFNLNGVELETLANLPGMTYELAAGIIDWRDDNEEMESGGAESNYYLSLQQPYMAKNDLFESVGELLLVKDITPEIFYGEDTNANGILDDNENDGDESEPQDNRDGQLERGLNAYVTVYSSQAAVDEDGQTRVNVNTGNQLNSVLAEVLSGDRLQIVIPQARAGRPYQNLIDFYYRSGLQLTEFEQLESRLTMGGDASRQQVNINTAPRQVLAAMPNLTESDVQAIIDKRESGDPFEHLSDVISTLSQDKAVAIGGMVKTTSYRYSADIVAVDGKGRAFTRLQVVFDAQTSPVRVLYVRDLTSLGWPLDPQILEQLRAGQSLDGVSIQVSSQTGVR